MKLLVLLAAALLLQTAPAPPPARADQRVSEGNAAKAEQFVDLVARGYFLGAYGLFDNNMKRQVPEARLKEIWSGLVAQVGPFQERTRTRGDKAGYYDVLYVTCVFEKASLNAKIVFDESGDISGLFFEPVRDLSASDWRPPAYVDERLFRERDLTIGAGEWALPATLTVPSKGGPNFPAVVLVHGSGPHDKDETIGPNKPFKDLAWGLASRGIAVLRYEKRSKAHADRMGSLKTLTVREEVVDDAIEAIRLLKITPGIDRRRIFLLGHSLGATLAPRIAAMDPGLAGLILLAGATRPIEELTLEQIDYISSLGATSSEHRKSLEAMKTEAARVKALDPATANPEEIILGAPAAYWLDLRGYEPAGMLRDVKQPVLVLQGERDYQVTMVDFAGWRTALEGRANAAFQSWPDLNHLFMEGAGKATPAEYGKSGHVAAAVIEKIATWIQKTAP